MAKYLRFLVLVVTSLCVTAFGDKDILLRLGDTEKNVKELRQENAALKEENRDMHQLIARLSAKIDKISNLATEEAIEDTSASTNGRYQIHSNVNSKRLLSSSLPDYLAFAASLNTTIPHVAAHQLIKYNDIITNEGNGYDATQGIFIAPARGLYLISVTLWESMNDLQRIGLDLVLNGKKVISIFADGAGTNDSAMTQTLPLVLKQGDRVWVRTHDKYAGFTLYGSAEWNMNSFSGVLLTYI
ncbi:complement C1q-like protein 2 [Mytilus edulis]|uniref:complement C1q-like protein 2 n=1 Tax=Mytilus edulis TaxID=6550 RepID=UPI0039EE4519